MDVLAPMRGPVQDRPVRFPAQCGNALPLRFLDFLLHHRTSRASCFTGREYPSRFPAPERFAVHKLLVAARGRLDTAERVKARKDVEQAAFLVRVLAGDRSGELQDV